MQGVEVLEAGGCPRNGQAAVRPDRIDAGNGGQGCCPDALYPSRDVRNAARPCSAALRCMVIILSASAARRCAGNPLGEIKLSEFSGMPLLGSIGIVLLMLVESDTRQTLRKAPARCAVVMLVALVAGAAFLDLSGLAAALLPFAPWACFLVLLWGFIESALSHWDRPRTTHAFDGAGAGGPTNEASLDSIVGDCRRARPCDQKQGCRVDFIDRRLTDSEDDLDSVLDRSCTCLTASRSLRPRHRIDGRGVRAPRAPRRKRAQYLGAVPMLELGRGADILRGVGAL